MPIKEVAKSLVPVNSQLYWPNSLQYTHKGITLIFSGKKYMWLLGKLKD